jgi:hypothetical protein
MLKICCVHLESAFALKAGGEKVNKTFLLFSILCYLLKDFLRCSVTSIDDEHVDFKRLNVSEQFRGIYDTKSHGVSSKRLQIVIFLLRGALRKFLRLSVRLGLVCIESSNAADN